jgi:hypothetical protein
MPQVGQCGCPAMSGVPQLLHLEFMLKKFLPLRRSGKLSQARVLSLMTSMDVT